MSLKIKKIIARHWLIICGLLVSFPLSKYIAVHIRAMQEARCGFKLSSITNIEMAIFLLTVYLLYVFFLSISWAIRTLKLPDEGA